MKLLQKEILTDKMSLFRSEGPYGMCCCNTAQYEAFIVMGVTALLTGILWRSVIVAPLKLVAVFLHEFSHASACWLTCGKVNAIEVHIQYLKNIFM